MLELQSLFEGAADFNDVQSPHISYFSVTDYVEERQSSASVGEIFGWLIILGFGFLILVGTLIQCTKLCDKPNIRVKKSSHEAIEHSESSYNSLINEGEIDPNEITKEFNHDVSVLYRKKPLAVIFLAFSAIRNSSKLVFSQKNAQVDPKLISNEERTLRLFSGLRFYCMLWILYANTIALTEWGVVENIKDKPNFFKNFFFTVFPAAFFAADVFFFISGFLAIYSILKLKNYTYVTAFYQYGRRLFRLIPMIAFVMIVSKFVISRFVEGPMCQRYNEEFDDCGKYFWTNLLMVNNFYPAHLESRCMSWTWFASVDFQMFLLVPLLGIIFRMNKFIGYVFTLFLVGLGVFLTALLNGLSSSTGANPYLDTEFFTDLYIKPWARGVPYFIGVYFGSRFFYYSRNVDENIFFNKIKYNPYIRAVMYLASFCLTFTTVFVLFSYTKDYGSNWSVAGQVIYATISPVSFIAGVTCLILPALLGKAKLIRFLLVGPVLNLLGRTTYVVALAHPVLMLGIYTTVGQQIYVESYKMFTLFVGHSFLIYVLSIALNILIELPARGVEAIWHDRYYATQMVNEYIDERDNTQKKHAKEEIKTSDQ
uniref:Acyltransferase 3 domain-containing protein n=1 Tax=Euplotes crassus TaxID=5936 RepID=A0A7S3NZG7_EUPCR|mmetsp:Transcript_9781/g.9620  ORF Transcript_9781/g.9620 Transcript_9781/m.9620 type:complete len:596 (+) Transcript_9781:392-2179(+)